jgi:FOG: TPR repeat
MATVYKTSDGSEFNDQNKAYVHEYLYLGNKLYRQSDYEGAIASYDKAFSYCSQYEYNKRLLYYGRAMAYYKLKDYDNAIDNFSEVIKIGYQTGLAYHFRGVCYEEKGNREQAIADYKKAADWGSIYGTDWGRNWYGNLDENIGKNNLERMGIEYTPETPPEVLKTWEEIKEAKARKAEEERAEKRQRVARAFSPFAIVDSSSGEGSTIIFGALGALIGLAVGYIIGGKIGGLGTVFGCIIGGGAGWSLGSKLIGEHIHIYLGKLFLYFILLIALAGGGIFLYSKINSAGLSSLFKRTPKAKTETTQTEQTANTNPTAEIIKNVNFRKGPSTNDEVIRQLKQGDIVILTGEVSGGWTQVTRDGEKGWVSNEYLKVWEKE